MTWLVPLALGSLAVAVMAVFTMLASNKRRAAHVSPAAVIGPSVLIHDINDDRCTGCDACVAVCPTNVLELIANKSRVVRFADCIQCEACMWACPTEALVMFPEGQTPPPLRVPEIDDNFQTRVPGQYLIGEVAGKPLVKNAANVGRAVIEHMLANGLVAGKNRDEVDVAIVGSGPGGLSAALSCIQHGLSYVLLEKEQQIASTIARYPKGKLVMAEPYDTTNLSLLPIFDSSKEHLIAIWRDLIDRVGVKIRRGESVESVTSRDGGFDIATNVAAYRSRRVVLAIGTRGKPRTLQVPGENLPKVQSLLEDPGTWRGKSVVVVGGGDSAVEAALALADAGARVMISYRGRAFSRCAPKNKLAIERYTAENRVRAMLQSQVLCFDESSVLMQLADGSQKPYGNDGAFVLIGADPPIAWLEKLGVAFVERPHQYVLGNSDVIVQRFVPSATECAQTAELAAAHILGTAVAPSSIAVPPPVPTGPRKWLRAATNLLTSSGHSGAHAKPRLATPAPKFVRVATEPRDQLSPGERTRVLRMLRDEGGRLADEDSRVDIIAAPPAPKGKATFFNAPTVQVDASTLDSLRQQDDARVGDDTNRDVLGAIAELDNDTLETDDRTRPGSVPPMPGFDVEDHREEPTLVEGGAPMATKSPKRY